MKSVPPEEEGGFTFTVKFVRISQVWIIFMII